MWLEKDQQTKQIQGADSKRTAELNTEKATSLPVIFKETQAGAPPFDPMKFQPVIGTDIFEAEFAVKGPDLIFHFWPYNYHSTDAAGSSTPSFKKGFKEQLLRSFESIFGKNRIVIKDDSDMGALFVKAVGWADNQFYKEQAIRAFKHFYTDMGGIAA